MNGEMFKKSGKLLKKLGFGMFCSTVVALLMNLPYLKQFILILCKITLFVFGNPELPPTLKDKVEPVIETGKSLVKRGEDVVTPLTEAPRERLDSIAKAKKVIEVGSDFTARVEEGAEKLGGKIKEGADGLTRQVTSIIEARAREQAKADNAEKEKLLAQADKLGMKCGDDWPLSMLRREVAKAVAEVSEKDELIVLANSLKMDRDESWSLSRLRAEVDRRLNDEWIKRGPNGRCPMCKRAMRVGVRENHPYLCTCGASFSANVIRSMGAPPRPKNFRGFNR